MCHHPPDWLKDRDTVVPKLTQRARLQLYGHKHVPYHEQVNGNSLRVVAGALHPERTDDWCPTYNVIILDVTSSNPAQLSVDLYARRWNRDKLKFQADFQEDGKEVQHYGLTIRRPAKLVQEPQPPQTSETPQTSTASIPDSASQTQSVESPLRRERRLTFRFLTLPYSRQIEIANALGLLSDEDKGIEDDELFRRLFERARQSNLLAKLWEETERRHSDSAIQPNPFAN
jgi:hypothetical protein